MPLGELIFVLLLVGGFLIPAFIFKQKWLFLTFLVFFGCFGLIEFIAVKTTGQTVSQHFWALDSVNPTAGTIIVGGMALGWIALLVHFKFHRKK